jgi:hypothetical protein
MQPVNHIINQRIMRNLFIIAIASLVLFSCKKHLDTTSPSEFTTAYVFSNETDAQMAVSGVYALFNQDAFTSRVSNNFTGNTDVEVGPVGAAPDNSRRDIWSFEAGDANADLNTVWNNAYKAINLANEVIAGVNTSAIKDNKMMKQIKGEALTLRAFWYYLLMNHWGDVPFKTTPTRAGDNFYLPRTGRDTILTSLINDLIEIEPDMYWADQLDYGIQRINREFVMGMIARLSLMRGGYWLYPDMTMKRKEDYRKYYEIANTYCKKLIGMKPHNMSDFATVFNTINKGGKPNNDDVLYQVAFQPGFGDVGWSIGVTVASGPKNPYGSTTIQINLTPTYYHSFDTTDLRQPVTCSIIAYNDTLGQNPTGTGSITANKWNRLLLPTPPGSASAKGTGIDWPLMRYADVLLMLAETENELNGGPTGDAINALKTIRRRAFVQSAWPEKVDAYVASVSTGKDAFFNAIVNERAWEFGGECLRKYDLERWNIYGQKIVETKNALNQMGREANAGTGTVPDYMYYKRNANGTITWLNKFTKVTGVPVVNVPSVGDNPNGYLRQSWALSLYSATNPDNAADYTLRQWRGYKDATGTAPVRYILPVHSSVVTSSRNAIYNTGMYGY